MCREPSPYEFGIPSGEQLRTMREVCGLSPAAVAVRVDYSSGSVLEYENDSATKPGREYIQSVLELYREHWPDDE